MSDYPVNISELRVMADYFTTCVYPYYEELREAFRLLRLSGCRISEIFQINRWSINSEYAVNLQPQKGNNQRTIVLDSSFQNFINAITGQYKPFLGRTQFQLQYLFSKINPYGSIYSGDKEITNYFFRYLFVRELQALGFNYEAIAAQMGYTSITAVSNYLNADLTSTYRVPVYDTIDIFGVTYNLITIAGFQIMNHDLYSDDNGTGIFKYNLIPDFGETFGFHYSPEAANRILNTLPSGWRLPTSTDLQTMADSVSYPSDPAEKLKDTSPDTWVTVQGNNSTLLNFRGTGLVLLNQLFYFRVSNFLLAPAPTPPNSQQYTVITYQSGSISAGPIQTEETVYSSVRFIKSLV